MKFSEVVDQAVGMIHSRGRVSYRALQREFELEDQDLDDLKEELLFSHPEIAELDGRGLVWNEQAKSPSISQQSVPQAQPPSTYTPQHLAERIRAEQAAMESRGAADGERKTITALFADLKGSTALIEVPDHSQLGCCSIAPQSPQSQ